jgi:two-component system sensor histidine kinase AgrC
MILWSVFNKKRPNLVLKNFIIILIISFISFELNNTNVQFDNILSYIAILFCIYVIYKKDIYDIVLEFDITIIILIIMELLLTALLRIIFKQISGIYSFNNGLIINLILLITCIGTFYLLPINKLFRKYIINSFTIKILMLNLTIWILCFKLFWDYDMMFLLNNIAVFSIMFLSFSLLSYILYIQNIDLNNKKKVIELNDKYSPVFENILDEINRKQHEFKNHLNAIYGMCYSTDTNILKYCIQKYIKSLNYSLGDIDTVIHINNKILAAVIYSKLCEAKSKQIHFSYSIERDIDNFKITEYEMVEVLSNLLNNAFEAIDDSTADEKIVYMKIGKENKYNFIEVSNKGNIIDVNNIDKLFIKRFSTKHKTSGGYGLYNVKEILESYDGHIQVFLENGYTIFKALF